ncbi:hypothetical protein [Lentzea sp. HUAS12]|uniref:hypothetical protein n=1 Tax=Lentzea sp. HUAS12 TaxID=2951806 RepID=UPI00209FE025|nr:hypothetical protein [Lentzea sp. HUAS12]USX54796.1 hypothetical protein ND450_12005 [Lentzea sp. HUAS12]
MSLWNKPLLARQQDIHAVLDAIDPALRAWVTKNCRISALLQGCAFPLPHPLTLTVGSRRVGG